MSARRRITRYALLLVGTLAVLALLAVLLLQTTWIRSYLREVAERQAEAALGVDVSIGALAGNLLTGATLRDVRITRHGRPVVVVPRAHVDYSIPELLSGDIDIASIALESPVIHLRRTENGHLNLAALGAGGRPAPPPAGDRPRRGWSIGDILVRNGTLTIGDGVVTTDTVDVPERVVNLDADVGVRSRPEGGMVIDIDSLSFQARSPALEVQRADGRLVIAPEAIHFGDVTLETSAGSLSVSGSTSTRQDTRRFDLQVRARNLQLGQLAPIVPALEGYSASPSVEATLQGSLSELHTRFDVRMDNASVTGDVTVDAATPGRSVSGTVHTQNLDLAALDIGERTDITMTANVDLTVPEAGLPALTGTFDVSAPTFEYGEYDVRSLDASGRIDGRTIQVDAQGEISEGTVQAEGTVMLPSDGQPIGYDLEGRVRNVDPSRLPAPMLPEGAAAAGLANSEGAGGLDLDFRVSGRGTDVDAEARLRDFSLAGATFSHDTAVRVWRENGRLHYAAEGAVRDLNLRRLGRQFGLEALADERYASEINAQFDLTGAGTELDALTLRGVATLMHSNVLGASVPAMTVRPDLTRGGGTIAIDGRFAGLDIGTLTGNPSLDSRLQGTVDATVALENLANPDFALGEIEAEGRLALEDSSIAGVRLDTVVAHASLSEAVARVRALTVRGPDLTVDASGTLVLDRTGSSDLEYFIDTPPLQRFGALGLPIRGEVVLEGRITGNLEQLQTTGALSGTQVGYGGTEALSVHSDYRVLVPDLSLAHARLTATTDLSGVEAAGRTFDLVKARMEYAEHVLDFGTALNDTGRTLTAEGRLTWHPDHQELHLRQFDFRTPEAYWQLEARDGAVIAYRGKDLTIGDLLLVSDSGGRVALEGRMGSADNVLTADITGLKLDHIDDLILAEEPLSGTVDATATLRGSFDQPRVEARVSVADGAYRGFTYQHAGGTIEYTPSLLRVDLRVEQSDAVALTASGVIPLSAASGEALDLAVRSTPIDLALVQTFTDEVSDVSGTLQIDATVFGSLSEPAVKGAIHVRNGAFTVPLAQSHYTGFDTVIALDGDVLALEEFHLVDDEGNRLRVSGELPLRDPQARGVNIRIESDDFEIADNRLAELNVDTTLRITGSLLRPHVEGRVGIGESFIRADRILQLTDGAYEIDEAAGEEAPSVFAPTIGIELRVPDTLVIRGSDLRAPDGGPVGLGDVNITIGGELQLRKSPGEDLTLFGDLRTVRGAYEFQGRQFTIERGGRITFRGLAEVNPRLDIRAYREISGVIASVHIGGVLDAPELSLSSQPPMEDAEILSLIVFNQPLSLLGTGQQISLASRATALASGFLASQLTESLSEVLELDLLEIEATTEAGALAPVLTLGEQFGDLYVRLRQRFGPEAVSEAVVEYRLAEWLRLQTSYSQAQARTRSLLQRIEAGGLDLIFFFSY